jgi:hypothetical protein
MVGLSRRLLGRPRWPMARATKRGRHLPRLPLRPPRGKKWQLMRCPSPALCKRSLVHPTPSSSLSALPLLPLHRRSPKKTPPCFSSASAATLPRLPPQVHLPPQDSLHCKKWRTKGRTPGRSCLQTFNGLTSRIGSSCAGRSLQCTRLRPTRTWPSSLLIRCLVMSSTLEP